MNKTHVLIINRNGLKYLKDCISDLQRQSIPFDLTVVDNDSSELGTLDFLQKLKTNVILNKENIPINHLWNEFAKNNNNKYLCFLNHDTRLPSNFIEDSEYIFKNNDQIAITCHVTNNNNYRHKTDINFKILEQNVRQGWDFTIRKEYYTTIPVQLEWFYGDDFIWQSVYNKGLQSAVILSSPIIHFQGVTKREKNIYGDKEKFEKLDINTSQMKLVPYSFHKPQFSNIHE